MKLSFFIKSYVINLYPVLKNDSITKWNLELNFGGDLITKLQWKAICCTIMTSLNLCRMVQTLSFSFLMQLKNIPCSLSKIIYLFSDIHANQNEL